MGIAVAQVFHNGSRKQIDILQHHAERTAKVCFFYFIDVDTVIADFAVCNIIKTVYQVGDRSLTCTGSADKGNFLSGLCI